MSSTTHPDPTADRPPLTAAQVAERAGFSEHHARRLIAAGSIPSVRYGRLVRVHVDALEDYLRTGDTDRDAR